MRTDSVNLSNLAIDEAKKQVVKNFGEAYANPKNFSTKAKGAQQAHEAVRPTNFDMSPDNVKDYDTKKIIPTNLRTEHLRTQMKPART